MTADLLRTMRAVFSDEWNGTADAIDDVVAASTELGRRRGPDVSRGLRRLLRDALARRDSWIRELSGIALLQSEGARGLPVVLKAMTVDLGDDMDGLQSAAMDELADAGRTALPAVRPLVRSREPRVRALGAWAIGCLGDPDLAPMLLALARDRSRRVRTEAHAALSELGHETA